MELKERIAKEVENAKYTNKHGGDTAERILHLLRTSGQLPFDFVKWYSGMEDEKILRAYERWIKETGKLNH